ncbi:MAG: hypothetical protein EKK41_01805 [Hyphomicrobiales bacterium]|nr:MAG: hypothetical protein EKK41_01805 [Hyphomicrobiales bacterium]
MRRRADSDARRRKRLPDIGNLFTRLRAWLKGMPVHARAQVAAVRPSTQAVVLPVVPPVVPHVVSLTARSASVLRLDARRLPQPTTRAPAEGQAVESACTVTQLPVNERGLLIRLARDLEARVLDRVALDNGPCLFSVSDGPHPRLWIDGVSFVSLTDGGLPYRVVLGEAQIKRVILETPDLAEVTDFVAQYLILTGIDFEPCGAAL